MTRVRGPIADRSVDHDVGTDLRAGIDLRARVDDGGGWIGTYEWPRSWSSAGGSASGGTGSPGMR